jgi:O-6-methylguanine DNA methyltransferase
LSSKVTLYREVKGKVRYYSLALYPTLFGEYLLVREFGGVKNKRPTGVMKEYFEKKRREFDCPLGLSGTDFQIRVWKATVEIPYGQVLTYKDLAERIDRPRAYRAVANALGANYLPILIPCHRVIASGGKIGGFSPGLLIKKFLLSLEGVTF